MPKNPLVRMFGLGLVASAIGVAIGLWIDWFPPEASEQAAKIDLLYDVTLVIAVPIFVLVMSVAIYSVVRYRARPGDLSDGEPIHGNSRLEVAWVAIPFVIVTALALYAWAGLDSIEENKPNALTVNVIGQQFAWKFEYPSEGGVPTKQTADLVLPMGRPVHFKINSEDVIHSFWIPAFRLKSDAVPGVTTELRVTPDKPGRYDVVCAELCGIGHSTMRQDVQVVSPGQYTAWRSRGIARPGGGKPPDRLTTGRNLFAGAGCAGCHSLADAGAAAATGPPLGGLAEVASKRKPGVPLDQYIRQSIIQPKDVVAPGYSPEGMPGNYSKQLTPDEIDSIVDYLVKASKETGGTPQ